MTSISVLKRQLLQRGRVVAAPKGHDGGLQEQLRLELMVARAEVRAAELLLGIGPSALSTNGRQVGRLDLQEQLDVATASLAEIRQRCIDHGIELEETTGPAS